MARYPTFDEYARKGAYSAGIKRCDELLNRNPNDAQLRIVKLRLLCASGGNAGEVLEQLASTQPAIQNLGEIGDIEAAVVAGRRDEWPAATSAGPVMAGMWETAFKASNSTQYKLELLSLRFHRAAVDGRVADAQRALIAIKALQPRNRTVYMAHAAYTQLLSASREDLQSRLAQSLARKAVADGFDEDKGLDCRVPGQIFALQESKQDLESIKLRPFRESQQVYRALKLSGPVELDVPEKSKQVGPDKAASSREWLAGEVEELKGALTKMINTKASAETLIAFAANAMRLFHTAITSLELGERNRGATDACFLAVSALVQLYADADDTDHLLRAGFLLALLLRHNVYVHEARLAQVYIYMRLGLGGLAIQAFEALSVKEIQYDTIAHCLFTGLSLTQPFAPKLSGSVEPHARTQQALAVYPRHEARLADCAAGVLQHAQTGMIFDLHALREAFRRSLTRRITLLEHRRIARLSGRESGKHANADEIGPRVVANWTETHDGRDFSACDCAVSIERTLYGCSGTKVLLYDLALDTAWALASGAPPLVLDARTHLSQAISAVASERTSSARDLCWEVTRQALSVLFSVEDSSPPDLALLRAAVDSLPLPLPTPSETLPTSLRDVFLYLDTLRLVFQTCQRARTASKPVPEAAADLQRRSSQLLASLQTFAKERAAARSVGGEVKKCVLADQDMRAELERLGKDVLDEWAGEVARAAREGWEGIGRVRKLA